MWWHTQWVVSLPRSCRHKNGDHMSTAAQMWCKLPCLVEWRSSYSGWWYSQKKSLHSHVWSLLRRRFILHLCKELQLLLYLQVARPRVMWHPLLWHWLTQLQMSSVWILSDSCTFTFVGLFFLLTYWKLRFLKGHPENKQMNRICFPWFICKLKELLDYEVIPLPLDSAGSVQPYGVQVTAYKYVSSCKNQPGGDEGSEGPEL